MKLSNFFAILGLSTSLVTFSSLSDTADKVMAQQCHPLDITCNPHIREHTKKVAEETWGEAGRGLYQAGAAAIGEDNKRIPLKALTPRQKELLRPEFGSLVDKVRIKYGADMLDRWGSGDFVISPGSLGQTFCDRIYIQAPFNENDDSQLILLAHELEHSRQCEKFGGMSNFGYRYFKEFKKANQNYENNLLEREAREVADRFGRYLASLPKIVSGNGDSNPNYILETQGQPAIAVFERRRESFALGCPEIRDAWGVTNRRGFSSGEFNRILNNNPVVADLPCNGSIQHIKLSDEGPHLLWIRHRNGKLYRHYINSTKFPNALRSGPIQYNDGPSFRATYPDRGNDFKAINP